MSQRVAIVGCGQTYHKARRPDVNETELVNEAVRTALEDAQISLRDIDSVFTANMDGFEGVNLSDCWMCDGSGAYMKPGLKATTGGTTGASIFFVGVDYVASGLYDTALVIGYQKHDEGNVTAGLLGGQEQAWVKGMMQGAIGIFANIAQGYMMESGAREEHAAMLRLKADRNALRNPYAQLRLNLENVEQVLQSPYLIPPLRLLDMCPNSSGAAAVVLASEDRAKRISGKPVWVADTVSQHMGYSPISTSLMGFGAPGEKRLESTHTVCARKLYRNHGITNPRKQIDVFEMYEPSIWGEMKWYEDFLFCEKGEGWKLVEQGVTEIDGELPVNPSGGVVSTNPIGATALLRVLEAALQVRGDAGEHQVPRDVKTAIATGWGGINWTTMVLLSSTL